MPTPPSEFRYPCENCGASLQFSPGEQRLVCPYCGHEQQIGPGPARAPSRQGAGGPWGEAAILATGRIVDRPWAVDGALAVRPVMQLSLAFDHRVVDGASGSAFLADVAAYLHQPPL